MSKQSKARRPQRDNGMTPEQNEAVAELLHDWYDAYVGGVQECMWGPEAKDAISRANIDLDRYQRIFGLNDSACGIARESAR